MTPFQISFILAAGFFFASIGKLLAVYCQEQLKNTHHHERDSIKQKSDKAKPQNSKQNNEPMMRNWIFCVYVRPA